eukprot:756207-Hanusia_phi.AAC.10
MVITSPSPPLPCTHMPCCTLLLPLLLLLFNPPHLPSCARAACVCACSAAPSPPSFRVPVGPISLCQVNNTGREVRDEDTFQVALPRNLLAGKREEREEERKDREEERGGERGRKWRERRGERKREAVRGRKKELNIDAGFCDIKPLVAWAQENPMKLPGDVREGRRKFDMTFKMKTSSPSRSSSFLRTRLRLG